MFADKKMTPLIEHGRVYNISICEIPHIVIDLRNSPHLSYTNQCLAISSIIASVISSLVYSLLLPPLLVMLSSKGKMSAGDLLNVSPPNEKARIKRNTAFFYSSESKQDF